MRKCLETTCTGPLTHRAWLQAGLATASGGLGLRHAALHGAAAYAAFVAATADLCLALDANYIPPLDDALRAVNAVVSAADSFPVPPPPNLRQQQLSQAVDRAVVTQLMLPAQVLKAIGLTFSSRRPLGPGPGCMRLHVKPLACISPARFSRSWFACACCWLCLTKTSHAPCVTALRTGSVTSPCGGDRTKRDHRLRSLLAARAQAAGQSPEIEKSGLLPPRPEEHAPMSGCLPGGCTTLQLLTWP